MRFAILGDSHLGALKRGWASLEADSKRVDLAFFAGHASRWSTAQIDRSTLRLRTSEVAGDWAKTANNQAKLDLAAFDGFVVIGLRFGIDPLLRTVRSYRYDRLSSSAHAPYRISASCFEAAMLGSFRDALGVRIAHSVRQAAKHPVVLIAKPFPSEELTVETAAKTHGNFLSAVKTEDHLELGRMFLHLCGELARSIDVTILPQWPESVTNHIFTKHRFSMLSEGAEEDDPERKLAKLVHANGDYGREMVQRAIAALISQQEDAFRAPQRVASLVSA